MVRAPFVRRLFIGRKTVVITAIGLTVVFGAGFVAFAATNPVTAGQSSSSASSTGGTDDTGGNAINAIPPGPIPGGSAPGAGGFNAVSCVSSTFCVLVGADLSGKGIVSLTSDGASQSQSISLPSGTPTLRSVSCSSDTACIAAGANDVLSTSDAGQVWNSHVLDSPGLDLQTASCPSVSLCLVTGTSK